RVRREAPMITGRKLDHVTVRHECPAAGHGRLLRSGLALHGVEDFDGMYHALEHLGEGALDHAFESLLEPLQRAHVVLLEDRRPSDIMPVPNYGRGTPPAVARSVFGARLGGRRAGGRPVPAVGLALTTFTCEGIGLPAPGAQSRSHEHISHPH